MLRLCSLALSLVIVFDIQRGMPVAGTVLDSLLELPFSEGCDRKFLSLSLSYCGGYIYNPFTL